MEPFTEKEFGDAFIPFTDLKEVAEEIIGRLGGEVSPDRKLWLMKRLRDINRGPKSTFKRLYEGYLERGLIIQRLQQEV